MLETQLGRKKHVYDGEPSHVTDRANRRSDVGYLEDALQRRGRVTEDMVSEKRTIHRMAPPGLKGFLGAEYANGYWKMDGVVRLAPPPPSRPGCSAACRGPRRAAPPSAALVSRVLCSAELRPCPPLHRSGAAHQDEDDQGGRPDAGAAQPSPSPQPQP